MNDQTGLDTGLIRVVHAGEPECYVTVPIADEPGAVLAVFQDGSTTRWIPDDADPDRIPPRTGPSGTGRGTLV